MIRYRANRRVDTADRGTIYNTFFFFFDVLHSERDRCVIRRPRLSHVPGSFVSIVRAHTRLAVLQGSYWRHQPVRRTHSRARVARGCHNNNNDNKNTVGMCVRARFTVCLDVRRSCGAFRKAGESTKII